MGISTFMGIETTLRGLLAQQRALDTTSHNITNAGTQGYSRQEAVFAASPAYIQAAAGLQGTGSASLGTGVDVTGYRRIRDQFLDLQYRAQAMQVGENATESRQLDQVEMGLAEPGENGISNLLAKFWNGWADVSNSPENVAARQALVDQAKNLASAFGTLDTQLTAVKAQAASEYASLTDPVQGDVAAMAKEIAALNDAIKRFVQTGDAPNDLMDRRDSLIDRLSTLAQVSVTDLGTGAVSVQFGDAALPLVNDATVTWPQLLTNPKGQLGALLDISKTGGTIDSYRADLNALVKTLADTVNAIHDDGPAASNFFGYTAGNEAGSLTVLVNAAGVETSVSGAKGANDIALRISALRAGAIDNAYTGFVTRIGGDVKDAVRGEANAKVLLDSIDDRRQSTSGVSMDEEMTNMVRFQRAYQASARAMSTMDEMLDILINRTGRVGI